MFARNPKVTLWVLVTRSILLLLLWWILSSGSTDSLWLGIPASIIVAVISLVVLSPVQFSWPAFFGFVPFFILHSIRGGLDVGRRAFHPALPISPQMIEYSVSLPEGSIARIFFSNIVNLLPGTLSTGFDGNILRVHVLDRSGKHQDEIEVFEVRVARIFNSTLTGNEKGQTG